MPSAEEMKLAACARAASRDAVKAAFRERRIFVDGDCIRCLADAANSYTVALLTNFLQDTAIRCGLSFSQETVFSHPSKVAALKRASEAG